MGDIIIRSLETMAEYSAAEDVQRVTWTMSDRDIIPAHALHAMQHSGAVLLGAFDGDRLAGFVFGFLGLTADGRLKHCSHMAGVHPDYRDHGVGYHL